jgi:hypothetical protein
MRFILIPLLILLFFSCQDSVPTAANPPPIKNSGEKILIRDRTGKEWDVTHAFNKYGFDPAGFQYGLGPNAIKPINNPQFFIPGDAGFPRPDDFLVIGTTINEDTRAYPINILKSHEIVNEKFAATHVAVAY